MKEIIINSRLELPYRLIDIEESGERFIFQFYCDITIGNVRDFAVSLENAYDNMNDGKAVLANYGSLNRSNFVMVHAKSEKFVSLKN